MTDNTPTVWIDILSDPAVTLAARAWGKGKAETWGILSRAIKGGYVSQRMTSYQFQVNVKLLVDPQYFNHCPVCKAATQITDHSCANCHVDLGIARRTIIEEEFKNFPIPPAPSPTPVLPKKTDGKLIAGLKNTSPPTKPRQVIPTPPPPPKPIRSNPALEKIGMTLFSAIAIIFWIAFAVFLFSFMSSFSDGSYDVPEPIDPREENYEEYLYDFSTPEPDDPYDQYDFEDTDSPAACLIKGNISFDTGEKIYHLPGQKYYDETTIDTSYGERWFCTEVEAIAAGWRKSRQ